MLLFGQDPVIFPMTHPGNRISGFFTKPRTHNLRKCRSSKPQELSDRVQARTRLSKTILYLGLNARVVDNWGDVARRQRPQHQAQDHQSTSPPLVSAIHTSAAAVPLQAAI